jgi:hypothetical protein
MHDAHHARGELVLILLRGEGHDHVLDESNLRLSKLHLTACCAEAHRGHFCDHRCDNELRLLCAVLQSAELLGDHHHGTNGRYLGDHFPDDRDLLADGHDLPADDLPNHHDHTKDDHRDHRDQLTDDHYLDDRDLLADDLPNHHDHTKDDHHDHLDLLKDDRDLPADDLPNHHDHTKDDHHDHRDLLTDGHYLDDRDLLADDLPSHRDHTKDDHRDLQKDDHDLGRHFDHMQDDLLDDCPDGLDALHDLPKDGRHLDDPGLRLVCLNDRLHHQHRRDGRDAMVCRILLPVADDVDRDFLGMALDEVYLQATPKRRTYAICD